MLMLVAKVLPVAMGKSVEIGRAYACGHGAAVAIGKSLEIGPAYACGQGVSCCHGKFTRN
ncbi:hypothetical protein OROMI_021309 [Orobanche minor]